jgi:hypothetical protein
MGTGDAAHAIITKGLTCGQTTACEYGTSITAGPFTLYCINVDGPVGGGPGGAGGSYVTRPLQPGEIHQLYQPLPDWQQYYVVPRDQEAEYLRRFLPVMIQMKFGNVEVEKQYMVPTEKARAIFKSVSVLNATRDRMSASAGNLKRVATRAIITVRNFVLRRSE